MATPEAQLEAITTEAWTSITTQTKAYEYKRLEDGEIRILTLCPGAESDELCVSLSPVSLSELPEYRAISYAWGRPDFCKRLVVAGSGTISITSSLDAALRRFRDRIENVRLWADAVCIDQGCIEEKDQQVQLMGKVYSGAVEVLIWLGEAVESDALAFWTIRKFPNVWRAIDEIVESDSDPTGDTAIIAIDDEFGRMLNDQRDRFEAHSGWFSASAPSALAFEAVKAIMQREYFERLWPVQEVLLSQKASVFVGTHNCTWKEFGDIFGMLNRLSEERPYGRMPCPPVVLLCADDSFGPPIAISYLLLHTISLKASVTKDHLFALRSIVADGDRSALDGSYADDDLSLFRKMTWHILARVPSLWPYLSPAWILAVAANQNANEADPCFGSSWIYELKTTQAIEVPSEYYIGKDAARRHSLEARWNPEEPMVLTMPCKILASVAALMATTNTSANAIAESSHTATAKNLPARQSTKETVLYHQCVGFCMSRHTDESKSIPKGPLANIIFAHNEENQVRLCKRQIKHHNRREAHTNWFAWQTLGLKHRHDDSRWFACEKPVQTTLAHLSDRSLAWLPISASVGDMVVLFRGAPRPFVVRSSADGTCKIIGDAEVPGLTFDFIMRLEWTVADDLRIV